MLKAIFPFFPISSLTLICCFRSFDVVSNFLVATSINPHVFRHIIVYNSFSRACVLFSILIVISYSFSSFTSSLLISYFLFSEFFFLFSALFSSKDIRFFSSSCSFYSLSQEKISESHHMQNAWVLPSTSHSTWNCNKTHCKEGGGRGNYHSYFSHSMGAFFQSDSHHMLYLIIWEIHGFPINYP